MQTIHLHNLQGFKLNKRLQPYHIAIWHDPIAATTVDISWCCQKFVLCYLSICWVQIRSSYILNDWNLCLSVQVICSIFSMFKLCFLNKCRRSFIKVLSLWERNMSHIRSSLNGLNLAHVIWENISKDFNSHKIAIHNICYKILALSQLHPRTCTLFTFGGVSLWFNNDQFYPYSSRLLHWQCGSNMIYPRATETILKDEDK